MVRFDGSVGETTCFSNIVVCAVRDGNMITYGAYAKPSWILLI